jgi:hypothetical protein
MKKSKIFMAAGALLLTVVGVATTKAHSNRKFSAGIAKYKNATGTVVTTLFSGATGSFLTATAGGQTAKIITASGSRTLITTGGTKLHFI